MENQKKIEDKALKYNASGCADPVMYEVIKREEAATYRFNKLLRTIFSLCELAGFQVEDRIVLRDKRTGKVWR